MVWKTHTDLENSDPLPNSGTEWPCKPIVESSGWATKWPNDSTKSKLHTPSPTPEDEAANKAQLPALLTVAQYLNSTLSLDDEDEFSEYIGEDGVDFDEGFVEGEEGLQDYDFFLKLFKEDDGLREYYEKNKESGGVFCCLVCCGVREKGWKRFKDCSSLVQHAITIAKTSKRRAHRAYCKVVCEILGWDVNKLPAIVLSDKPVKAAQGNADDGGEDFLSGQCKTTNSISISDTEVSLLKLSLIDETQQGKDGGSSELEENSVSKCKAGVDGLLEDLSYLTLETHKGASGCVEPSKECPVVATEEKESQKDDADHKNHK
ncbi:hypothetical protein K7X08_012239 [Anisodus acutangulus]|uniref:Uncharacterized protein n=1 Tax=Anisodus acutangulus TaxID=402998 RepID=A0A9Q1LCS6_9SOLA|nr:hypothetical protein K7X08_012239 [Anisodus acutangulus]